MKLILSATVANRPGVLTRISGLFARRGFNIFSLAVGPTEDAEISRMTIVVDQAEQAVEQVEKQLHKLIDVIKIQRLEPSSSVSRGMIMIKVNATAAKRVEILDIVTTFRGKVTDLTKSTIIVEVNGDFNKLQAFQELMVPYGIVEVARTGQISLARGK